MLSAADRLRANAAALRLMVERGEAPTRLLLFALAQDLEAEAAFIEAAICRGAETDYQTRQAA